jgi:hypothetical protein
MNAKLIELKRKIENQILNNQYEHILIKTLWKLGHAIQIWDGQF